MTHLDRVGPGGGCRVRLCRARGSGAAVAVCVTAGQDAFDMPDASQTPVLGWIRLVCGPRLARVPHEVLAREAS